MIAVLFEADAVPKHQARYLQLAGELRPELDNVKGFISIERFQSLSTQGKILSLSWWENEEAVLEWKKNMRHQAAQKEGQKTIFSHYRIRVANVLREYSSGN
ncbi:antibiotic biosynthesis monooxygenase [Salmonella enterica subsp. salamae]|nr:antibiotic biosynthesis monooxygenase [Salmonella enterica]EAA6224891.1 antibiotic biosynthesis monooxygenase [Salmonella enterica subsp. salamae]EBP3810457.1 antibiotic biosynthesis monooxygenase [Salmonella enterica subsp. enterica]MBA2993097.1 antibiotic biosynthesis monooxygenase [Salmonella enterica subsp. salamae serovar 47:z:e,n,x,z15]HAE4966321.1 antibiotic biosynthesis monooxygenase [Salmonella enterica subsp. salamae serovar 18:z10:z6]HAE7080407.1 antibiotic biosynthesis monooxyge